MTINSILIQNVTPDELSDKLRTIVREEILLLQPKEAKTKFLTRQEVAELLKISLPTLNTYTQKGIIKASKIGIRILYSEDAVLDAVKQVHSLKYRWK
jgi:excisionase family DNA binding protein